MSETPEQRFKRIAERRANKILKELNILSHCGDRKNYDYEEEQVNAIFEAINSAVQKARSKFSSKRINTVKL